MSHLIRRLRAEGHPLMKEAADELERIAELESQAHASGQGAYDDFQRLRNMLASIRAQARLEMWFDQRDIDRLDALLERTANATKPAISVIPPGYAAQTPTIYDAIAKIDSLIVRGPLQGDGFDKTAERNGLILACNTLHEMLASAPLSSAPIAEQDAKDAARYRWLRDKSVPPHNFYISVPVEFEGVKYSPREVDVYIDAAMLATPADSSEGK